MAEEILTEETKPAEEVAPVAETLPAEEAVQTHIPSPKKFDFQKLLKEPLFWGIAAGVVVVLCIVILVGIALGNPKPTPAEPEKQNNTPDTNTVATESISNEPTYLPIDRNPIGMTDFWMDGNYLSCLATPSVVGIDVSEWQGSNINWKTVKDSGVDFVIIRVGGRFADSGTIYSDARAQANYAGASAAGLKIGAYFYSQAISPEEAIEEARYLLEAVKDWNIEMPVVYDWEYYSATARTAKMDARTLTDCTKAFCETVKQAGYTPMIYFNTSQSLDLLYLTELEDYLFWLAQYNGGGILRYDYKIDMWQYTETGTVPGIEGYPVDINLYFPYEE